MKIAMIDFMYGYGIQAHVENLVKELSKIADVHIISFYSDKEPCKFKESWQYALHKVKASNKSFPFDKFDNIKKIIEKVKEINPNIVHSHATLYHSLALLKLKKQYPIVCTIHSLYEIDGKFAAKEEPFIARQISFMVEKKLLRNIPNFIVCSNPMKELINKRSKARVYVAPNGINAEDVEPAPIKSLKHPAIYTAGRLTERKGIPILLRAIKIAKSKVPDISLYISGSGPKLNELKQLSKKLDLEHNVNFLGFVSQQDLYSYYKSTDFFVICPIGFEHAPVVLPEAMACKKAIIGSNIGGIPDMVEHNKTGLLVEPGNASDLAEKILLLIKDPQLCRKMGQKGFEKIKNYNWVNIAKKTMEVYNEIIENFKRSS